MSKNSKIEWTDHTFSPWWGCVKVSPACDHCYAESFSKRVGFSDTGSKFPIWGKDSQRRFLSSNHWNEPLKWNREAEREGVKKRVFCGSMCDVMEEREDLIAERRFLYGTIDSTPYLDWLLLTKRPQNFKRFLPMDWLRDPRPNVWGMTTVESSDYLWRIDALLSADFNIYGLSLEPLLGHVILPKSFLELGKRGWCITGGESGPHARPSHPDWFRSLRDQCGEAGVPFHFKQHGEWKHAMPVPSGTPGKFAIAPREYEGPIIEIDHYPRQFTAFGSSVLKRVGKKAAGRLLDGRTWDELPEASA